MRSLLRELRDTVLEVVHERGDTVRAASIKHRTGIYISEIHRQRRRQASGYQASDMFSYGQDNVVDRWLDDLPFWPIPPPIDEGMTARNPSANYSPRRMSMGWYDLGNTSIVAAGHGEKTLKVWRINGGGDGKAAEARSKPARGGSGERAYSVRCSVCMDDVPISTLPQSLHSTSTAHLSNVCEGCWGEHIRVHVEGGATVVPCADAGCSGALAEAYLRKLVGKAVYDQ